MIFVITLLLNTFFGIGWGQNGKQVFSVGLLQGEIVSDYITSWVNSSIWGLQGTFCSASSLVISFVVANKLGLYGFVSLGGNTSLEFKPWLEIRTWLLSERLHEITSLLDPLVSNQPSKSQNFSTLEIEHI